MNSNVVEKDIKEKVERKELSIQDMLYMDEKVIQWNILGGTDPDNEGLIPTYTNLCIEEIKEAIHSQETQDIVELVDACCDSIFTGFFLNRLVYKESYGKSLFEAIFDHANTYPPVEPKHLLVSLKKEDLAHYTASVAIWVKQCEKLFDVKGAFKVVCDSNFSKFPLKKDVDVEEEVSYILSQGRYEDVFAEEVGDRVVFKAKIDKQEGKTYDSGKVVKPQSYKSPDDLGGLANFIYN